MAKKSEASSFPAQFDPEALYDVVVGEMFEYAKTWVRPGIPTQLSGEVCEQFRDKLISAHLAENQ